MNKLEVQVYENGEFTKDQIEWIEQTEENTNEYLDENYIYDHDKEMLFDLTEEEEINGLHEIVRIEKGHDKYIVVYQYFKEYDYLVQIEYGEMTYPEWYACKDFKTLLAFIKEIEPLLDLIERNVSLGYLEAVSMELESISNKDNDEILQAVEIAQDYIKELKSQMKRRNFTVKDTQKEIIKAMKK